MRRLAHGGTVRPPVTRPGNGYARLPRRCPGPLVAVPPSDVPEPSWFSEPPALVEVGAELTARLSAVLGRRV